MQGGGERRVGCAQVYKEGNIEGEDWGSQLRIIWEEIDNS